MENYYALIMAGGGGTRLWPLSRRSRPKQMLSLMEKDSMFRMSVLRLEKLFPFERIFIVTGEDMVDDLRADVPELPPDNFIVEPYGKNTGPADGLALAHITSIDPEAVIAILTADHYIRNVGRFLDALRAAYTAATEGYIVTLGITPDYPATGFGYIEQGGHMATHTGFEVYESKGFKEKPDQETARQFIEAGTYSWNSGMFIWKASPALEEFALHQPQIAANLAKIRAAFGFDHYSETIRAVWDDMPNISIDYAVMEKAERMATIPVDIGWSDIGSWAAVYEELVSSPNGSVNLGSGQHINLDSKKTLVFTDRTVVTIGLDDLVIIDVGDVLMICSKDRAQDVRLAVDYLKQNGLDNLL